MINNWVGVGRIVKQPELKKTQNGVSVVSFTLAINRQFASQNGEREADFINVVAYRSSADFMNTYVKKGNLLGVVGRIQTRSYEATDGKTVYVTEVIADSVQLLEYNKHDGNQESKEEAFHDVKVIDKSLPF